MKLVNNNTYSKIVKDNDEDRLEIEIGDIKQPDFFPQVKLKRWDNEVNVSFRLVGDFSGASVTRDGNKIKCVKDKIECHLYELPPKERMESGGLEFEVILKEKPTTNVIKMSIETKGLRFNYQPPLTEEEQIFDGRTVTETEVKDKDGNVLIYRPENVVGSYAAYHKTKKNHRIGDKNYKCGKAFHIYRPKIEDSDGNWVWGELNIDEDKKELTVTIPQEFLNNAVYPVRHAAGATFGYTSEPVTSEFSPANYIMGTPATISENGDGVSISRYTRRGGVNSDTKCALYLTSDDSFVKGTEEVELTSTSFDWIDYNFTDTPSLIASTEYYLCTWSENGFYSRRDTGVDSKYKSQTYNGWPDPVASWTNYATIEYSIYCTYTPVAASSI